MTTSSADENCQVASCSGAQFTFCPHCSLNICIKCLNEHYILMENDYKRDLVRVRTEINPQRRTKIDEQRKKLAQFYQKQIDQHDHYEKFFADRFDQFDRPLMKNFRPNQYLELKEEIKQLNEKRLKFDHFLEEIDGLMKEYEGENDLNRNQNASSTANELDRPLYSPIIIELDNEDSFVEFSPISHCESPKNDAISNLAAHVYSFSEEQIPRLSVSPRTSTLQRVKDFRFYCPLTRHDFGLTRDHLGPHGVISVPCSRSRLKISRLHTHLTKFHHFNNEAATRLVTTVMESNNRFEHIDLFSHLPIERVARNPVFWYSGLCPLTKYGLYGILPEHRVPLCNGYQPENSTLRVHLIDYHGLHQRYATRLTSACLNNLDPRLAIVQANENLLVDN